MGRAESPAWHHRVRHALRHSIKRRLVALFLLLALALAGAFMFGMQKALSAGWREAARPLVVDYVDRLAAEIGSPPSTGRAGAITQRLPVTVRISGPQVNWRSHPDELERRWRREDWMDDPPERGASRLLSRSTADGHRIDFGLNFAAWRERPRYIGWATLGALLLFTLLAYAYVRRLLRPLDDIGAGARRFGSGDFSRPIAVTRDDELGQLAADVNGMASNIHGMLEAKRALLLAISHELRSPLTRARLHTELLPQGGEAAAPREALLRDLALMRDLVTDLLESERLGAGHTALHLEPVDVRALLGEVLAGMAGGGSVRVAADKLPLATLDRTRTRLLLRNLLDNALRHSERAPSPPEVSIAKTAHGLEIVVRDHGPGVDAEVLPHLAEPFFRPDASRERATGGVGLGLHLCKLVALAHGGSFELRNAAPGLEVRSVLKTAYP